jgi:hypothetical protein
MLNKGINDYSDDLEKYVTADVFNLTLDQYSQVGDRSFMTHYENFTLADPAIDFSDAHVGFTIDFPNYNIKLSGLKFQIDFDYSLSELNSEDISTSHGSFLSEDMTLVYASNENMSEAEVFMGMC